MKLTRSERERILAGDHSDLRREEEPPCEEGDTYVLIWSRAQTWVTDRDRGEVADLPRRRLLWVEFGKPVRHRKGGWRIGAQVHDQRTPTRFMAPTGGPSEGALSPETERGYRSSSRGAIDDVEAVDDDELARQQVSSRERWSSHQEEEAAEERARAQERRVREELKQAVRSAPTPDAAQALLAAVEREIRRAQADE